MQTTRYFDEDRSIKHPDVSYEQAVWVARNPEYESIQPDGRLRRWVFVEELNHYVRVVLREDE